MEEYTPEESEQSKSEEAKRWFQDNLRIIVSVIVVVLIAGGIYSYSKRSTSPVVSEKEEVADNIVLNDQDSKINADGQTSSTETSKTADAKKESSSVSSQETVDSFIETAGRGDGLTVLARRSLANYLEKTPDSTLTKEHKIYIEDYLRKNVGYKGGIHVGTSVEFSKNLIEQAIAQSKNLNERQLQNLQKYSARVSSLS